MFPKNSVGLHHNSLNRGAVLPFVHGKRRTGSSSAEWVIAAHINGENHDVELIVECVEMTVLVVVFSIMDGDHRLRNYLLTLMVYDEEDWTTSESMVIESYVMDMPFGNNKEDISLFVDATVGATSAPSLCLKVNDHLFVSSLMQQYQDAAASWAHT